MLQTYRMYGDSSLVVIGESSFQVGLYFIHYDFQTLYTSKRILLLIKKSPKEAFSFPFIYHYVMCHNV